MTKAKKSYIYMICVSWIFVVCLGCVRPTVANDCDTNTRQFNREEVFQILRSDGFSGVLDENVELSKIGAIEAEAVCLRLFVYVYTTETYGGPMGARRMTKRLLILTPYHYLGMYAIDELPIRIADNKVEFPGREAVGNVIVFESAIPPKTIFLDGEQKSLFK